MCQLTAIQSTTPAPAVQVRQAAETPAGPRIGGIAVDQCNLARRELAHAVDVDRSEST